MKRRTSIAVLFLAGCAGLWACEMSYSLAMADGRHLTLQPGQSIALEQGKEYRLILEYYEDHRACIVGPDATLFFLDGSRWRPGRETAGLLLLEAVRWESAAPRQQRTEIPFVANQLGSFELEIIRECSKGGYQGSLSFLVSS